MRFSDVIAASLVAPLVAAHGGIEGAPKVFGLPKQLRARNPFAAYEAPRDAQPYKSLHARQTTDGRCGPEGSGQTCAAGECCSGAGYCGTSKEHCQAPDCLIDFGPGCDANKTPAGATTRNDARPQLGNIPYGGEGIYVCNKPGTVALTYDDGPYIYTDGMLDLFKARGAKATFFITGNNIGKGAIDENWSGVIKRMIAEGHQVASHTWSHQDLSKISDEQVYDQMVKNEMAIRNIIGKYPTYMRPPYSSCEANCQSILSKLGYVVSYFDLDTDDYNQLSLEKIQVAKNNFKNGIDTRNNDPYDGDRLAIAHDIHELTATNLTSYMLDYLYSQGLTAVTMGECLNDPEANWYRDSTPAPPSTSSTRTSTGPTATPTGPTSTDGTCGSSGNGQSCVGFVGLSGLLEECCSQYGYCGQSEAYCQTGCQQGFGKCGTQPSASPSPSASASATSTGPVPTPTGPTSTDGTCGASGKGQSCIGFIGVDGLANSCCSAYGWCGNSADHCQTGCQLGFGKCGSAGLVSSSVIVSASSSSSAATSSVVHSSSSVASSSVHASSSAASSVHASSSIASSVHASSSIASSVHGSSTVVPSSSVHGSATASHVSTAPSATPTTSGEKSRDGSCGGEKGYTCVGFSTLEGVLSECCSAFGFCGSTPDHCGSKCNPIYGNCPSVSSSTPVSSKHDATSSAVPSSTASAYPSGSVSKSDKHDSTSVYPASSTGGYPASTPVSVSKDTYPSGSAVSYPASSPSPVKPSGSSVGYPASSPSAVKPSSTSAGYSASSPSPVKPSSTPCKSSTFSTIVKPSSTPCKTSTATPTPTPQVSKDGNCGPANGGQTCVGYKNPFGEKVECCCKQSGKCSTDPWACGVGCDKGYGKCNSY